MSERKGRTGIQAEERNEAARIGAFESGVRVSVLPGEEPQVPEAGQSAETREGASSGGERGGRDEERVGGEGWGEVGEEEEGWMTIHGDDVIFFNFFGLAKR
jgi:hypothetical protein